MADEIRGLTKQDLADIVAAAVAAANRPDPLREKELAEQLATEKRRTAMMLELGKIEEASTKRKKDGCTHSRLPMSAGKFGGHAARKGEGEWTTGGQLHSDGTATLICTRCSWTWHFQPTLQERDYIEQQGMLGMAPPAESRLITEEVA
jgi:hypothetical protein